jgi:hypothetical protein
MMPKTITQSLIFFLTVWFFEPSFASSMVVFDFDDIHSQSKKVNATDIEAYMEGLFGADLSISRNTTAIGSIGGNSLNLLQSPSAGLNNGYLKVGKGKGTGIILDFGDNPIDSFSVDFRMFKRAKNFTILADGVVINAQTLSKAERKTGLAGHQSDFFFDTPVHTLQFVGKNKKSFAIDNLVINIPVDEGGAILNGNGFVLTTNGIENPFVNSFTDTNILNQVTAVSESSSLLMLAVGLCGALVLKYKPRQQSEAFSWISLNWVRSPSKHRP